MATEKEKRFPASMMRELFTYDDKSGKLFWNVRKYPCGSFNGRYAGKEAFTSTESKGYKNGEVYGINMKAHRVIWAIIYGDWPDGQIDHIDGNKSNNKPENLRQVDNKTNCRNQSMPKSNTSGYLGVSWNARMSMWHGKYKKDYKTFHVGYFNDLETASYAVNFARSTDGFHKNHGRT